MHAFLMYLEIRVMLLLSHAADQRPTQKRLEAYMSASSSLMGNDEDPKAVAQRVKLMELYILHVLPKVDEWAYAREFTQGSNDLDDDQKEVWYINFHENSIQCI